MPRNRTITDQEVLEAAIRLVGKEGVGEVTFASLGDVVGLAPSTLVQRFGTKQGLLAAATEHCLQTMGLTFEQAARRHDSPLAALRAGLVAAAGSITSAQEFANGQAFLYLGLTDAVLSQKLQDTLRQMCDEVEVLLKKAITAEEIVPTDTYKLAQVIQAVYEGATITWAVYRQNSIEAWVGELTNEVIKPYIRK